jgi:multidrug efflux pump subunit AcrA (membrane-fusion protein)
MNQISNHRPRSSARLQIIDSILFKEGDVVDSGDLLYVIDPRPYQAALDQAKGQLEQALAQQKLDNANLERSKDLLAKRVAEVEDVFMMGLARSGRCLFHDRRQFG